jgi:tRNA dimethylallyltransferase
MPNSSFPPLITIFGPTAVGKSALAILLAEVIGGEIVTADSRQVYRRMDIGTDKPSPEDQARVSHHMIDLVEPDEPYTLAMYQQGATQVIEEILARGNLPILAGGTPLYINALTEGWTVPRVEPNPRLRRELESEASTAGSAALHERLARLDPTAAERILPSNTRRIIRALEVISATGRPISEQQRKEPPPYRILRLGLHCERAELYRRIDERVDRQFARGLVDEVENLHRQGYSFDLPSMSGLGYRQVGDYLRGLATLDQARQRIKWDTHAFVRHQSNWFRRIEDAHWIDATNSDPAPLALALVQSSKFKVQSDLEL